MWTQSLLFPPAHSSSRRPPPPLLLPPAPLLLFFHVVHHASVAAAPVGAVAAAGGEGNVTGDSPVAHTPTATPPLPPTSPPPRSLARRTSKGLACFFAYPCQMQSPTAIHTNNRSHVSGGSARIWIAAVITPMSGTHGEYGARNGRLRSGCVRRRTSTPVHTTIKAASVPMDTCDVVVVGEGGCAVASGTANGICCTSAKDKRHPPQRKPV